MARPSRADRFRPAELIGFALVVAVFVGVVAFISTRDFTVAVIFLGGAFVVALVLLAMLALAAGPIGTETSLRGEDPAAPRPEPGPPLDPTRDGGSSAGSTADGPSPDDATGGPSGR
ncbi:hypothetical protein [Herbiconiux sp. L3-i23]|uniref:hypothetical protein n=1 Tax=Herbiconiux sp. L3-i23 TaxID=2905871 RepID=UPI002060282A|nr:hypothetical protein [Herbiconiux sp. L3-i23]BDI24185.1 hypothetical protein L3i23_29610 [Herbiconiux sp. L3-i23]